MKIGINGIEEGDRTLAGRWSEKDHSVSVANSRGPSAVQQVAARPGP
jgi:predicted dinucleotide-binding enzyme